MTELVPYPEATPEDWRNLFRKLFLDKINHIIVIGGHIRQLHDEVIDNPRKWGNNWVITCREIIGIDHSTASQYETIWRVLGGDLSPAIKSALPARMYTLYLIARAVEVDHARVSKAVTSGVITTHMSQKDAKHFLDEVMSIEEEHEEVREVKEAKKPLTVRTYPDDMIKRVVESDINTMRRLYGDSFLQVLKMRRDLADVFGVIQKWDTSFEPRDVSVLLKMLLDE
jgi:hypothetical protein